MFGSISIHFLFFFASNFLKKFDSKSVPLRVLTFNTWNVGQEVENGFQKIVKHILEVNPDIVAIQEWKNYSETPILLQNLGSGWASCQNDRIVRCLTIVRRHLVRPLENMNHEFPLHTGCRVSIGAWPKWLDIDVWNIHLWWKLYGPYAACSKWVTNDRQLEICETASQDLEFLPKPESNREKVGRVAEINALMSHGPLLEALAENRNILILGDFNSPSHLDWVPETRISHCGAVSFWPVSKKLHDFGFFDSFRVVKPDAKTDPGTTWSSVYKFSAEFNVPGINIEEPQDRIDRIYFRGPNLIPIDSQVYHGNEPISLHPNYQQNDWPSDHSAVFTDFIIQF